ncbi:MAG: hypothetical protein IIX70_01095 [Oscillospiraceae bacterium]|nr:hypothetical protein [Oscillospiraceae bacterium]MBQ2791769.1 hypothetical protein [Oscillospiraceae bacterium]MBQ7082650.1 hypothetical protein [Oscillospiraceae bacterium]
MDSIKEKVQELVKMITEDKELMELFKTEPVKAVEKVLGVDLPDDMVQKIIDSVKAQITLDKAGDLLGSLKKLF